MKTTASFHLLAGTWVDIRYERLGETHEKLVFLEMIFVFGFDFSLNSNVLLLHDLHDLFLFRSHYFLVYLRLLDPVHKT